MNVRDLIDKLLTMPDLGAEVLVGSWDGAVDQCDGACLIDMAAGGISVIVHAEDWTANSQHL